MTERAQRIVLASRPVGEPTLDNFRLEELPIPQAGPGQMLLRSRWLSLDPYMRGRMSDVPSYAKPVGIGEVMGAAPSATWSPRTCPVCQGRHRGRPYRMAGPRAVRWLRPAKGRSHARADLDCPRHTGHDGLRGAARDRQTAWLESPASCAARGSGRATSRWHCTSRSARTLECGRMD